MHQPSTIVEQALCAFNQRRLDEYLDIFDDSLECHDLVHGPGWGRLAIANHTRCVLEAIPDAAFDAEVSQQAPDCVTVSYRFAGTHRGRLEGIDATGSTLAFEGQMILRVVNGVVVERWSDFPLTLKLQAALASLG